MTLVRLFQPQKKFRAMVKAAGFDLVIGHVAGGSDQVSEEMSGNTQSKPAEADWWKGATGTAKKTTASRTDNI